MQINQEFRRITTFKEKLDQYSLRIMSSAYSTGGAAKMKVQRIRNMLLEVGILFYEYVSFRFNSSYGILGYVRCYYLSGNQVIWENFIIHNL